MNRDRWERIQALFHEAAERPIPERRSFLEARAPGEPALVDEVLELLDEDARGDSLLHRDLADVAGHVLAGTGSTGPRELGRYRLGEVLGEGGMGVVYLAQRTDIRSLVAIKILRDAWLSPARRERFASEQRTLAQLNHPNIARLYDADTLPDGTPWFAMEYVDGLPLTRYCNEHAATVSQVLRLFRSVCEAVLHAHQLAVIHRDLKPSNILVTRGGQAKLLDFGIAKQLEDSGPGAERTRTELRFMTPAYAAPEQIHGGRLGVHTDIYSLGVILYELLTGHTPFEVAGRPLAEVDRILTERTLPPSAAARERAAHSPRLRALVGEHGVSWSDLDVLVLTAIQKDPDRRYRTVDSLIRDIDHYLRGEPIEARPDTFGYRTGKFVRRHWRPVAVAAAALVFVIGLVAFYTIRLTTARNTAVAEADRARRIQEFMNGLFQGGNDDEAPPESLRVVSLLARGVDEASALVGAPIVQADLYQTLGGIYQSLGNLDRADSLLTAALTRRRAQPEHDHPDVARNLVALGLLRADQSKLDEAVKLVEEGLEMSRRQEPPVPGDVARATTALGAVLLTRGDYDRAIQALEGATRLDSLAGVPETELTATLTELANAHFYSGHYSVSDSLNHRVLEIDRRLYGPRHPHVASDLVNLGAVQQEWGRYREAEAYYRQALGIYRGWYGENHYETAATLTMVGRMLVQQDRLVEARDPLEHALAIRERVFGKDHPNVASTLNELSLLAQREGRLDDAEAGFRRMVEIYRVAYHDHHFLIGLALANLGSVYVDRKDYRGAETCFRQALDRYAATLPPDHLYQGIAHLKLGRALLRQGRYVEAEHESSAGYSIVRAQAEPAPKWMKNARTDLAAEYEALKQPERAAEFRAQLEAGGETVSAKAK